MGIEPISKSRHASIVDVAKRVKVPRDLEAPFELIDSYVHST
eukprot:XP_001708359.1 Hypothetical protein GL50803_36602 [Giardia lamblia ATCC 50803]